MRKFKNPQKYLIYWFWIWEFLSCKAYSKTIIVIYITIITLPSIFGVFFFRNFLIMLNFSNPKPNLINFLPYFIFSFSPLTGATCPPFDSLKIVGSILITCIKGVAREGLNGCQWRVMQHGQLMQRGNINLANYSSPKRY